MQSGAPRNPIRTLLPWQVGPADASTRCSEYAEAHHAEFGTGETGELFRQGTCGHGSTRCGSEQGYRASTSFAHHCRVYPAWQLALLHLLRLLHKVRKQDPVNRGLAIAHYQSISPVLFFFLMIRRPPS